MKYSIGILVCSILLSFILLSSAASAAEVSIVLEDINTEVGKNFTINVTVDPAGNEIYGAQYTLHFNPAILKTINQTKGSFLSRDGASTIEVTNRFDNTLGTVEYGETRMGVENGIENPGTLASITFEVIGTGTSDLEFFDVILSDPSITTIETVINNETYVVGGEETSTNTPTSNSDSEPSATITPTSTVDATQTPTETPTPTEQVPTITPTSVVATGKITTPTATPAPTPTASPGEAPAAETPGFEAILCICAILAISVIISKSKRRRI